MRVVKLKIKNIKRIKAVQLEPKNNINKIKGKNGQGKSSILDSMMYALGGKSCVPSRPIREGEKKGEIVLEVEGYRISKTITESNEYLKVTSLDSGEAVPSPQKFLNDLCSGRSIAFDPIAFSNKSSKEQVEIIKSLANIDTSDIDNERTKLSSERKDKKAIRDHMKLDIENMEASIPDIEDDAHNELSIEELTGQLKKHSEISNLKVKLQSSADFIADTKARMESTRNKIKRLQEEIESLKKYGVGLKEKVDSEAELMSEISSEITARSKDLLPEEEINKMLESASSAKSRAEEAKRLNEKKSQYSALCSQIKSYTDKITELDNRRRKVITSAKMPIKGLEFSEDEKVLIYNGIPFEQASQSERIKVGMAISFAMNNNMKIALIRDGSLLDEDSLDMIEKIATKYDGQVWVEIVSDDDSGDGFYIEDGEIK